MVSSILKLVVLSSGLLLLVASCKTDYQSLMQIEQEAAQQQVRLAPIEVVTEVPPIESVGSLGALSERKLSFKIGGIIRRLMVDEGQSFQKGAVIALLDKSEINAQVKKAQENVTKLERDLARTQALFAEKAVTLEAIEDLTTALEVAKSDLEIAHFNQQYATITAPVSGKVLSRFAEEGELTAPGSPIFLIAELATQRKVFQTYLSDKEIVRIQLNDKAVVQLDAYPNETFTGKVTQLAEQPDPRTLTYAVEITLDRPKANSRSGFIGSSTIYPSQTVHLHRIPMKAIQEADAKQVRFFVVKDNVVQAHEATPTLIEDHSILTATRLNLEETQGVIVASNQPLKEGQKIIFPSN